MTEAMLFKLLDMAFNAVSVGLERQVVLDKVRELELAGRSADEIAESLKRMRDEAIAKAANA
jgi:hypothetical protein